jgi:hypothetical protein
VLLPSENHIASDVTLQWRRCRVARSSDVLITALPLQEKQFVKGTNVDNVKERTGKHCSLRWRDMSAQEKLLYTQLAEAELLLPGTAPEPVEG